MALPAQEKIVRPEAVAIYVRWSTEEQGEGTTLQEQLERCKSYVVSQGWLVNEQLIFVDEGYSGATLDRPAITRLRGLVNKGQIDCVISLKIDRLSRSLVDCVDLVLREWAGVCHYKSVSQPVNTTDELSRVFFAILAGFAEYERALIHERTFSGLLRRVKEGNFWGAGKAPYGYKRVGKGQIAVDETEAAFVRLIFRMAGEERLGASAISSRLNEMGVPSPEGKGWWAYTVRSILKNRIYLGYMDYGKRVVMPKLKTAGGNRVVQKREKPLVEASQRVDRLVVVEDTLFEVAQHLQVRRANEAKEKGMGYRSPHLLTGILKCKCGSAMITGYDAREMRYYRCQSRDRSRGGNVCTTGGGFIYAEQIEQTIGNLIGDRYASTLVTPEVLREQWLAGRASGEHDAVALEKVLADLQKRESQLGEDVARITRMARRGEITLAEKREFDKDIEAERLETTTKRASVEGRLTEIRQTEDDFAGFLDWVDKVDKWAELPLETKKELLRHLVERIVVFKPKGRGMSPEIDVRWLA